MRRLLAGLPAALLVLALDAAPALAQHIEYERPVETAPTEETIGEGYATPQIQRPRPRSAAWQRSDVALLAVSLGAAAWPLLGAKRR